MTLLHKHRKIASNVWENEPTPFSDLLTPAPWTADALCAQVDHDLFYPEKGGSTRDAKNICRRCPVTAECLDYAMDTEQAFGIWGGTSAMERRKMRRAVAA